MIAQQQIKVDMRYVVERMLRRLARWQWCRRCHQVVEMVPAYEAAAGSAAATMLRVYRAVKSGVMHGLPGRDGSLLICRNSLSRNEAVTEEFVPHRLI